MLSAEHARSYDLYFGDGSAGLHLTNPNHCITVSDGKIAWTTDGRAREASFASITAVHLGSGAVGNVIIDQCRIEFIDGRKLVVSNWDSFGRRDESRVPIYRDFVRDLHARLAARSGAIRFTAGFPPWRYNILRVAAACLGLLCLAALVTALAFAPGLTGLGIVIAVAVILVPVVKLLRTNAPRDYTPDRLPDDLLS